MALLAKWSSPQAAPRVAGAAAVAAHLPALGNALLRDDVASIRDKVELRTLSGLARVVTHASTLPDSDPGAAPIHRPLHAAFEWITWELLRSQPAAQHALSIALHAACAMLVVRLLLAQRVDGRIATAAALLFAVHPVTAAATGELASRALVLATLAFLFGAVRAAEAKTARAAAGWTAFGVVTSALSHEAFFFAAIPLVLFVSSSDRAKTRACALGAVLALGLGFVLSTTTIAWPPLGEWASSASAIGAHDLFVVLVPPASSSYFTPGSLTPLVLVAGVALGAATALRVSPLAGAGAALIVLAPIGFAPAAIRGGVASDRGAYVVLLGLAIVGAAIAQRVARPPSRIVPSRIIALAPYAVAVALVPLTWAHVIEWRDDVTLLRTLAADRPDDEEGKLADALLRSLDDRHAEALPECEAYATKRPLSTRAHSCVGTALLAGGDPAAAAPFLRAYAERHPDDERARRGLVAALFATDGEAEARAFVMRWRNAYPKAPDVEAARAELVRRGAW